MLLRDRQPELMDDPDLPRDQHEHALAGLARLNRFSGVSRATFAHVRRHAKKIGHRPFRILDVASGSGDVPLSWLASAKREGLNLELTMSDISPVAVEQQQCLANSLGVKTHSLQLDCLKSDLPDGFDMVTCSLFMHHLDDHQVFRLLQSMQSATDNAILICDLHRSRFNLAMVSLAAHLLTRSHVVHTDSALSVRAAYTGNEFKQISEKALARPVKIRPSFPCRFIATFDEKVIPEPIAAFA